MPSNHIETDYLIIGAGAMGMAFADVIFDECPDAQITLVDRRAQPGGHWNDAYSFVALHQPAAGYGVNSARLERGGTDLSSRAEILSYYERVMKKFLASDRVCFLPMSEYRGEGQVVSILNEDHITEIEARSRIVDGTYMKVEVPSTHAPKYEVGRDVTFIPLNGLVHIKQTWQKYVVIGAGKTGIDAVLFLLAKGVAADQIQWIMSNDMWMWNRDRIQPRDVGFEFMRHADAVVYTESLDDAFLRLEHLGSLFRMDQNVMPSKWRCATVDKAEFRALLSVKDIVRMGRVESLSRAEIKLEGGTLAGSGAHLYIDCSANGLAARGPKPLFSGHHITLQSIMMCQQVFSAAVIGHLETMKISDDERNAMCEPVPHPEYTKDFPTCLRITFENLLRANRSMPFWLLRSRLNLTAHAPLYRYAHVAWRANRLLPKLRLSAEKILTAI